MGPLLFGSGDKGAFVHAFEPNIELQWGRCFLAAEISSRCARFVIVMQRFNGAAAFWQRRYGFSRRSSPEQMASMGPLLFGSGDFNPQTGQREDIVASMGPLLFGSGDTSPAPLVPSPMDIASMGPL